MFHLNINNGGHVIADTNSVSNYAFCRAFKMRADNYRKRLHVEGMTHMTHNAGLSRVVYQMQHAIFQEKYTYTHMYTYIYIKAPKYVLVFAKEEEYTSLYRTLWVNVERIKRHISFGLKCPSTMKKLLFYPCQYIRTHIGFTSMHK